MDTYHNPIKRRGDFADPFVLRHDGRYYLYCTNPDVRCWSSTDLVNWKPEGPTIADDEFPGLVPFAPEVVYAEGAFYMYTSPSGHGHYVLRAQAPTGPFRAVSGNVGHSIDGHIFIDDDGRWYFYWASDEGIWGCEMGSPTEFGIPVFTGAYMNGWTEGPFVTKRDGVYHMTLTGNHYLSHGYRINAAYSRHPLRGYQDDPLNPILVNAAGSRVGLGHSSSVRGPDLVSTYVVYHNLNPDASRDLNIDRQVWNGQSLQVLGPSISAPLPATPDASSDWGALPSDGWHVRAGRLEARDGAGYLAGPSGAEAHAVWRTTPTGATFTAELNLTAAPDISAYGVSLGPCDCPPALILRVDRDQHTVAAVSGATGAVAATDLPRTFAHDALHCWLLVSDGTTLRLVLDGRLQLSLPIAVGAGSALGVIASGDAVRIGYCGLTNAVADAADRSASRPVPGRFWAALAPGAANAAAGAREETQYQSVVLEPGAVFGYRLYVQQAGRYKVYLSGAFASGDVLTLAVDDRDEIELRVDAATRAVSACVEFERIAHTLTLRGSQGRPVVALITVAPAPEAGSADVADGISSGYGKWILAPGDWDDFALSATLTLGLDAPEAHADVLLRASQLSEGGEGDDTRLGIDFLLGYSVQIHRDRIVLARHDYDECVLAECAVAIDPSVPHALLVRVAGGQISIRVNGTDVLEAEDPLPHLVGQVGIRTANADLRIHQMHIEALPLTHGAVAHPS